MIPLVFNGEVICVVETYEELMEMIANGEIQFHLS